MMRFMTIERKSSSMVTQTKAPKVSSTTRHLLKRASEAGTPKQAMEILFSETRERVIKEVFEDALYQDRKKVLLELANLHDGGFVRFQRRWGARFSRVNQQEVFNLRDGLRSIWDRDAPRSDKESLLDRWVKWVPRGFYRLNFRAWHLSIPLGRLVPDYKSLHAQLVQGVLEHSRHFARCGNPGCPAPYFLARRTDQKYCERGECTRYAQNRYALKWWGEHGLVWRANRKKGRPKRAAKGKFLRRTKR
jgi:hypothetical protein